MPEEVLILFGLMWICALIAILWWVTKAIHKTKDIYWFLPFFWVVCQVAVHAAVRYYGLWTSEASVLVRTIWAIGLAWLVVWIIRLSKKNI